MRFIRLGLDLIRPAVAWDVVKTVGDAVGVSPAGPWICGGSIRRALRNEKVSDVDLFVRDAAMAATVRADRASLSEPTMITDLATSHWFNGTSPATKVQVVTITMGETIETVLSAFDFNESALGYDGQSLVLAEAGLMGLLRGHLSINKECRGQFPGVTARRILKYAKAGLQPCEGTLLDLLLMAGVDTSKLERKYVD